jgi:hypothetical protein
MISLKQRVAELERRVNELQRKSGNLELFVFEGYWEHRPLVFPFSKNEPPEPEWDLRGMFRLPSDESREDVIARYLDPVRDYGMIMGRKWETHESMLNRLYPKGNARIISFVNAQELDSKGNPIPGTGGPELRLAKYGATSEL